MWTLVCSGVFLLACLFGGLLYWAIKNYWQEMPGLHDLDDANKE